MTFGDRDSLAGYYFRFSSCTGAASLVVALSVGHRLNAKIHSAMTFTKGMMKNKHHAAWCPVRLSSLPNGSRMIASHNNRNSPKNAVKLGYASMLRISQDVPPEDCTNVASIGNLRDGGVRTSRLQLTTNPHDILEQF